MDTVTETSMAVAMAALGGIGMVHYNNTISQQASIIRAAKSHKIPFSADLIFATPSDSIHSADEFANSPCIFVTESGNKQSKLLGHVSKSDWKNLSNKEARISAYMNTSPVTLPSSYDFNDVAGYMASKKLDFVALVNEEEENGEVVNLVTSADTERIKGLPKLGLPSLGEDGKFLVGAAVGTRESDKERLEHLVKEGINAVVIDSSQGNSLYQINMIKHVKHTYPHLDVIGGNVVTNYQAENLIKQGVDGLRVGGNVVTAFFRILVPREPSRVIRNGITPDSAMILRLSIPVFMSNLSLYAACLCISGDPVCSFPTKNFVVFFTTYVAALVAEM
ncbi:inosine-5'-monophosphate dehydrogenase 2-like [Nicotiana sylvestris]|uniref:inosine-5'-monophosphate dehydrogenase 2-like n=1 Tax=Nicotiana sylvestris TaxID=4096 RepID=UPI00388C8C72